MKQKISSCQILGALIMLFFIPISLSHAQEKALDRLIEDSNLIIVGNVKEIKCEWENGNIWTYVTIECSQTLKGNNKLNEITIRSLGGNVGNISQIISGSPKFKVGEILLSFLKKDKHSEGIYYCIGGGLGKYRYEDGNWIQNNSKQPESFISKIKSIVDSR